MEKNVVYVGIDLGTTNTLACYMNKGKPELFKFPGSGKMLPSVLYVGPEQKLLVGEKARKYMLLDPTNGVRSAKTYIGKFGAKDPTKDKYAHPYMCNGLQFTPTDVATEVLKEVKKAILKKTKSSPDTVIKAVITVPAYFNQNQKEETNVAGKRAGLEVIKILAEPTAAAIAAVRESEEKEKVLVVDLGGGTFDLAILEAKPDEHTYVPLKTDGDGRLGGDDFNYAVYQYLVDRLQQETGLDLSAQEVSGLEYNEYQSMMSRLLDEAEAIKIGLSEDREYEVNLTDLFSYQGGMKGLEMTLTRAEFNAICQDLYDAVTGILQAFLQKQDRNLVRSITRVILAGGSCYLPYIQEKAREITGKPVDAQMDLSTLVVTGACFVAESAQSLGVLQTDNIRDILSHSFGVEVVGESGKDELSKILYKDDAYPVKKSAIYTTDSDYQDSIELSIYEAGSHCEDIADIEKHDLYGSFILDGIEKAPKGEPQIEITFEFDANACLHVTAEDKKTGAKKQVKVIKGQKKMGYCVDVTMLIDATGSMSPIIQTVKNNALSFCAKFQGAMKESRKDIEELRMKVIAFRDYEYDGNYSMDISPFYNLPQENESFRKQVARIEADGGGDAPESSLEALALAMNSDWTTKGHKRRHIILIFTDADAVPLCDPRRTSNPIYPQNMPQDFTQLSKMWKGKAGQLGGMPDQGAARLVIFAPSFSTWNDINSSWDNVWFVPQRSDGGLRDVDIGHAISVLVKSTLQVRKRQS